MTDFVSDPRPRLIKKRNQRKTDIRRQKDKHSEREKGSLTTLRGGGERGKEGKPTLSPMSDLSRSVDGRSTPLRGKKGGGGIQIRKGWGDSSPSPSGGCPTK